MRYLCTLAAWMMIVCWTFAVAADDTAYDIVLHRPARKGDRYRMTASATTTRTATARQGDRQTSRTEVIELTFEALVRIEEVNPKGLVTKARYGILACEIETDGKRRVLVPKGRALHVTAHGDRVSMRLGLQRVDPEVAGYLEPLVAPTANRVTDDEILGSRLPRKVGQSWPMDAQRAASDLRKVHRDVKVDDVTGTVILDRTETVDEMPCLVLKAKMTVKGITPPVTVPRGLTVAESTMTATMSAAFPLDESKGRLRQSKDSLYKVVARGKPRHDAPEVEMTLTQRIEAVNNRTYLPAKED